VESGGSPKQDPSNVGDGSPLESVGQVLPSSPVSTCPSCNTTNDADARFCKHCGHSMEAK
jgi:hypothetical protein